MSQAQKTDLEFMQSPEDWPNKPYLPLQKGDTKGAAAMAERITKGEISIMDAIQTKPDVEFGFLIEGFGPIVFLGNFQKDSKRHTKYESFQAIISAGWQID